MQPKKTVLITGCSRNLGLELCKAFHRNDWKVIALIRNPEDLGSIEKYSSHQIVQDITDEDCSSQIKETLSSIGAPLDMLINNAGLKGSKEGKSVLTLDPAEVTSLFKVSCVGPLNCVKGCLPALRKSPNPLVVQISSRLASLQRAADGTYKHLGTSYSYRIAKAAQNMMTLCLAQELESDPNISTVALHPGALKTAKSSKDANTSTADAAEKIYRLLVDYKSTDCAFIDADKQILPW